MITFSCILFPEAMVWWSIVVRNWAKAVSEAFFKAPIVDTPISKFILWTRRMRESSIRYWEDNPSAKTLNWT